jgi:hypothetical protein
LGDGFLDPVAGLARGLALGCRDVGSERAEWSKRYSHRISAPDILLIFFAFKNGA